MKHVIAGILSIFYIYPSETYKSATTDFSEHFREVGKYLKSAMHSYEQK